MCGTLRATNDWECLLDCQQLLDDRGQIALIEQLDELMGCDVEELLARRSQRYRAIGAFA